jgi:hypothetical protein
MPVTIGDLMSSEVIAAKKFPILTEILAIQQLPLRATYTIGDVARLFGVTQRAIHNRVASGQLSARDLPGRARFLSEDIEAFLVASKRKAARRGH